MSKPATPTPASNTLLLRRQLVELNKNPVEGFSAGEHGFPVIHGKITYESSNLGLVDEDNLLEWEVMIIGCVPDRVPFHRTSSNLREFTFCGRKDHQTRYSTRHIHRELMSPSN